MYFRRNHFKVGDAAAPYSQHNYQY